MARNDFVGLTKILKGVVTSYPKNEFVSIEYTGGFTVEVLKEDYPLLKDKMDVEMKISIRPKPVKGLNKRYNKD